MCIASLKKKKCTTSLLENRKDTCASSFKCQLSLSYSLFPPFSFAILFTLQTSRNEQEISRGSYSFLHFYLANNSLQSHYKQNRFKVELSLSRCWIYKYQNFKYSDIHSLYTSVYIHRTLAIPIYPIFETEIYRLLYRRHSNKPIFTLKSTSFRYIR